MALVVKDRVQETSTTTGTGTLTLSGAATGYQTFSSAIGNTNTTYYAIQNGAEWEVGIGTVGSGILSRDTVLESSNAGSLVNLSAGSKFVFCTYPAEKSVYVDSSGNVNLTGNILLDNGNADGAQLSLASSGYSNWNLDNYSGRFRAYYNATEYFTIDASGNVGIGTSSPSNYSNSMLTSYRATNDVWMSTDAVASTAASGFRFYNNGVLRGEINTGGTAFGAWGGANSFNFLGLANAPMTFATNSAERMRISAAGGLSVGTTADPGAGAIYATGNITAYYSSDVRLKENIKEVDHALEIVCAIGSKTFDWTDEYIASKGGEDGYFVQKSDFGVVAQDVQEVFPQAVRTREDGTLAVDYEKLATLSFGAIKSLLARVEALEAK